MPLVKPMAINDPGLITWGQLATDELNMTGFWITDPAYGATGGGSDETTQIQAAIDAAAASIFSKRVIVPLGTFKALDLLLSGTTYNNVEIAGFGEGSILATPAGTTDNHTLINVQGTTTSATGNVVGFALRNLQLRGTSDTDGFVAHRHLLTMGGVTRPRVEGVLFKGSQGDGIYVGHIGGNERHNYQVRVTRNVFDGINQANRCGTTIIDADVATIEGNDYLNYTTTGQPGPIDIEPNPGFTWAVVRGITVRANTFSNCRANTGLISLVLQDAQASYTTPSTNVVIEGNLAAENPNANALIFLFQNQTPSASTVPNEVTVRGNQGKTSGRPYEIAGMRLVRLDGNMSRDAWGAPTLGWLKLCRDIAVSGETHSLVGGSNGFEVYRVVGLSISDCEFDAAGSGQVLRFPGTTGDGASTGSSDLVDVVNLRIKGSGPTAVVLKDAGHTVTNTANNWITASRFNGLSTSGVANVFGNTANNH